MEKTFIEIDGFIWKWCDHCQCSYIECQECGNNCCNGGSGTVDGKKCTACLDCYAEQHRLYNSNEAPQYSAFSDDLP